MFIEIIFQNDIYLNIFTNLLRFNQRNSLIVYIISILFILGGIFKNKIVLAIFTIYPHNSWIVNKFGIKGLQFISIMLGILLFCVGLTI